MAAAATNVAHWRGVKSILLPALVICTNIHKAGAEMCRYVHIMYTTNAKMKVTETYQTEISQEQKHIMSSAGLSMDTIHNKVNVSTQSALVQQVCYDSLPKISYDVYFLLVLWHSMLLLCPTVTAVQQRSN